MLVISVHQPAPGFTEPSSSQRDDPIREQCGDLRPTGRPTDRSAVRSDRSSADSHTEYFALLSEERCSQFRAGENSNSLLKELTLRAAEACT